MGRSGSVRSHVELSLPAAAEYLYLARLHAGAIGARAGMAVDDVEDLRLAVDELCQSLLRPAGVDGARLHLEARWDEERLDIRCRLIDPSPLTAAPAHRPTGLPASLTAHILDALVDAHGSTEEDGDRVAWLIKSWNHR